MGEGDCQRAQVQAVSALELPLAKPMLLGMVRRTQAHGPAIGRLKPDTPVSAGANVGAFDGDIETTGHAAMMTADPGAMTGAFPLRGGLAFRLHSIGKPHGLRLHQDEIRRRLT